MTRQILVYGDSQSWGIIPGSRARQPFPSRWPGIVQCELGDSVRVNEACLNGRTTRYEDPNRPARHGINHLRMTLESHSPIDLLIIMLGVNDYQDVIGATAAESAEGLRLLVEAALALQPEPMTAPPKILVVIPPEIQQPMRLMADKFSGFRRGTGSEQAYLSALKGLDIAILQASQVTGLSEVDGVHFDAPQHQQLGIAVARAAAPLLEELNADQGA